MMPGEFMTRGIEDEAPHVMGAEKFFQIIVGGALPTSLVGIHSLSQNLRPLILNSMPGWA